MRRESDRDGADLHYGLKSQHRDSAVYTNDALVHKGKQKRVRRTARLVAILGGVNSGCDVRFLKFMRRLLTRRSFKPNRLRPGRLPWMFVPSV
eukprot:scaffold285864_cov35-Attheya_sp.AAC.1